MQRSIATNTEGLQQLEQGFDALNIEYIPSVANFMAFKIPASHQASAVFQQLLAKGIIVRPWQAMRNAAAFTRFRGYAGTERRL